MVSPGLAAVSCLGSVYTKIWDTPRGGSLMIKNLWFGVRLLHALPVVGSLTMGRLMKVFGLFACFFLISPDPQPSVA